MQPRDAPEGDLPEPPRETRRREGPLLAVGLLATLVAAALTYTLVTIRRIVDLATGDGSCDWANADAVSACLPGGVGNLGVAMVIIVIGAIALAIASHRTARGIGFVIPGLIMSASISAITWTFAADRLLADEDVQRPSRFSMVLGALLPLAIGIAIAMIWRRSRTEHGRSADDGNSIAPWIGVLVVGALLGVAVGLWYADRVV